MLNPLYIKLPNKTPTAKEVLHVKCVKNSIKLDILKQDIQPKDVF
jgi:hypothetical protein